jgi:hypothetical protein
MTAQAPQQRRRKRYKARLLHISYIDVEVLAHDENEARDNADKLHMAAYRVLGATAGAWSEQFDNMILVGDDEILNPPGWPAHSPVSGEPVFDIRKPDWYD